MAAYQKCQGCRAHSSYCVFTNLERVIDRYNRVQYQIALVDTDTTLSTDAKYIENENMYQQWIKDQLKTNFTLTDDQRKELKSKQFFRNQDSLNRSVKYTCRINKQDHYNIMFDVPKYSDSKFKDAAIFEPFSREVIKFASKRINWESQSVHTTTGDEFQTRQYEWIHPNYHMIDSNDPLNKSGGITADEVIDLVGENNFYMVSDKWGTDVYGEPRRAIAIPNVYSCEFPLYGSINTDNNVIEHISMKDNVVEIEWFQNYTIAKYRPKKLNVFISSDETLLQACVKAGLERANTKVLKRLVRAFELIRNGKYINLHQLLLNNGIDKSIARKSTTNIISTKNPKQIYCTSAKRYNMDRLLVLYKALEEKKICLPLEHDIIDAYKTNTLSLLYAKYDTFRFQYMCNIINYVLNDPDLKVIRPELTSNKLPTTERYWNGIDIVIRGIRAKLIKMENIPLSFRELVYQHKWLMAPEQLPILRKIEGPEENFVSPAIATVKKYLQVTSETEAAYQVFKPLLQHIKRTVPMELVSCWEHFVKAYNQNTPELFWRYIENISNRIDIHDVMTIISKESYTVNLADQLWDAMISEDSFEVFPPSKYDSLLFPGRGQTSQPRVENYEAVYERAWLEAEIIEDSDKVDNIEDILHSDLDLNESLGFNDIDDDENYSEYDNTASDEISEDGFMSTVSASTIGSEDLEFILSNPFNQDGSLKTEGEYYGNESDFSHQLEDE